MTWLWVTYRCLALEKLNSNFNICFGVLYSTNFIITPKKYFASSVSNEDKISAQFKVLYFGKGGFMSMKILYNQNEDYKTEEGAIAIF